MQKKTIVMFLLLALAKANVAGAEEGGQRPSPYRFSWLLDAAVVLGSATLWLAPSVANTGNAPLGCNPCDGSRVNGLDRWVIGNRSSAWDRTSDVLAIAIPSLSALGGALSVHPYGYRGWFEDLLLVAESMSVGGMLNQLVRHAVRRPRPFMYEGDARLELRSDFDSTLSFYSGHTSTVFAAATTFTYSYFLRHPEAKSRWLVLAGSLLACSIMPVARVAAGEHFVSDVLAGAAVGTAVGLIVPALHRRPRGQHLALGLALRPEGGVASLVGNF